MSGRHRYEYLNVTMTIHHSDRSKLKFPGNALLLLAWKMLVSTGETVKEVVFEVSNISRAHEVGGEICEGIFTATNMI